MRVRMIVSWVLAIFISGVSVAEAQDSRKLLPWSDVSVSAARVDYDLGSLGDFDGVGQTNALVVRATRALGPHVDLEVRGMFAHPREQFGSGWLVMPEAQVQYHWRAGRLEPYVGAGLGAASVRSQGLSDWDPTVSAAVGTAVRVTERLALTGEFRLRGHEWRVTGTTAEFSAGLSWRLGTF